MIIAPLRSAAPGRSNPSDRALTGISRPPSRIVAATVTPIHYQQKPSFTSSNLAVLTQNHTPHQLYFRQTCTRTSVSNQSVRSHWWSEILFSHKPSNGSGRKTVLLFWAEWGCRPVQRGCLLALGVRGRQRGGKRRGRRRAKTRMVLSDKG